MKVILHDCFASSNLLLLFAAHLCAFLLEKYSKDKKADNIIQFWQLGRKNILRSAFLLQLVIIVVVLLVAVSSDATQGDASFTL